MNRFFYNKTFNNSIIYILIAVSCFILSMPTNTYSQTYNRYNDSLQKQFDFINAASEGDINYIKRAIILGVNINHRDADGGTALFYAISSEQSEVVKTLLYNNADPNIALYNGFTPLMNAAGFSFDMAELLLLKPETKLNLTDKTNSAAIHYAAYYGQTGIVDMLLFYGADAKLKSHEQTSAITLAAYCGDLELIKLLEQAGNDIFYENKSNISAFTVAIQNNDSILFDYMFAKEEAKEYLKNNSKKLLTIALYNDNNHAFNSIISEINISEPNTIYRAAYLYNNSEAIDKMVQKGYKKTYTPIPYALQTSFSTVFNNKDYFSYFGLGIKELRYKLSLNFMFGTRFKYKAFWEEIDQNTYYQHWERRNQFSIQLRKDFNILEINNIVINAYGAFETQWHWVKYRGFNKKLSGNLHIVPEIGMHLGLGEFGVDFGFQYTNYELYEVSPYKIKIGISYQFIYLKQTNNYTPIWM